MNETTTLELEITTTALEQGIGDTTTAATTVEAVDSEIPETTTESFQNKSLETDAISEGAEDVTTENGDTTAVEESTTQENLDEALTTELPILSTLAAVTTSTTTSTTTTTKPPETTTIAKGACVGELLLPEDFGIAECSRRRKYGEEIWGYLPPDEFGIIAGSPSEFYGSICLQQPVRYLVNATTSRMCSRLKSESLSKIPQTNMFVVDRSMFERLRSCLVKKDSSTVSTAASILFMDPVFEIVDGFWIPNHLLKEPHFVQIETSDRKISTEANFGLRFIVNSNNYSLSSATFTPENKDRKEVLEADSSKKPAVEQICDTPGYARGQMILVGNAVDRPVPQTEDVGEGLPIMTSRQKCFQDTPRYFPARFGQNTFSSCGYELEFSWSERNMCEDLEKRIQKLIWSEHVIPQLVGVYGNSKRNDSRDWVPVYQFSRMPSRDVTDIEQRAGCRGVLSGVKITVLYTYIGWVASKQATIAGLVFNPLETDILLCEETHKKNCLLRDYLTVSLNFQDVSPGIEDAFVSPLEFPPLDLRLPHDFFYPFLMQNSQPSLSMSIPLIISTVSCTISRGIL